MLQSIDLEAYLSGYTLKRVSLVVNELLSTTNQLYCGRREMQISNTIMQISIKCSSKVSRVVEPRMGRLF